MQCNNHYLRCLDQFDKIRFYISCIYLYILTMATTSAISTLPNISISSILSTIDNRRSTIYDLLSTSKYKLSTDATACTSLFIADATLKNLLCSVSYSSTCSYSTDKRVYDFCLDTRPWMTPSDTKCGTCKGQGLQLATLLATGRL